MGNKVEISKIIKNIQDYYAFNENKLERIVITSGGFDCLHDGHIEYLKRAKNLAGDKGIHICILNNDKFLMLKKGYALLNEKIREKIMSELKCIDLVILSIDEDLTVYKTLETLYNEIKFYKILKNNREILFVNGGDRENKEIPEAVFCRENDILLIDGLGKKINSSSELVNGKKGGI